MTRECKTCHEIKTLDGYYTYKARSGEVRWRFDCKECDKKRIAKWQKDNPERYNKRRLESYHRNKARFRERFKERYHNEPEFRRRVLASTRSYNHERGGFEKAYERCRANKDAAFAAYGGYLCQRCKITDPDVLNIDHEGGRKKHNHGPMIRGWRLYSWLKTHGYPSGFRVLCYNCNIKAYKTDPSWDGHRPTK